MISLPAGMFDALLTLYDEGFEFVEESLSSEHLRLSELGLVNLEGGREEKKCWKLTPRGKYVMEQGIVWPADYSVGR